jgi:hypothetical protein
VLSDGHIFCRILGAQGRAVLHTVTHSDKIQLGNFFDFHWPAGRSISSAVSVLSLGVVNLYLSRTVEIFQCHNFSSKLHP